MSDKIKFAIGYQLPDRYSIADIVSEYRERVSEVYFPWLGVPDGRGISISNSSDQAEMEAELRDIAGCGVKLNLLWNANCYGDGAVSKHLANTVRSAVSYLKNETGLSVVTTTSLFVADVCHREFPDVEVRASVNMGIGSAESMRYVESYFDSFYVKRELNRSPEAVRELRRACGKKLYLLANSGCLADCSAHSFHDNLVAHEHAAARIENEWPSFRGICWKYYADKKNHPGFLTDTTWIRPEDISRYEGIVDGIKLATRTNLNPLRVIEAYMNGSFDGNMLSLCEPDFSSLAEIRNKAFPADWFEHASDRKYREGVFSKVYRESAAFPFVV